MRVFKIFLSIVIILGITYATYTSLFKSDFTKIKKVTISGVADKIIPDLKRMYSGLENQSFWKVDVIAVAEKIKTHPWVQDVEIKKLFPNEIAILITQREPSALINNSKGVFNYVDGQGHVFGPAETIDVTEKIILSGKELMDKSQTREPILEVIQNLPQTGALSHQDISEIKYQSEKGYQILLSKTGIVVDLGKENLPLRVDRARRVVQYLEDHKINASHVDADYSKKVLVKVRKPR
ncbi:MAG: cell division protein FtsQ/DivIB [Oligoflexia bacterium]|nr:cell division protein FtsQ/DivIB [Oligoflexia bacterium]